MSAFSCFGHRKHRGRLLGLGALVLVLGLALSARPLARGLYDYLAPYAPLGGEWLVVEGWVPDDGWPEIGTLFETGNYELLITTGGPHDYGQALRAYPTFAESMAASALAHGLPPEKVRAIPAPATRRDRTFQSACSLAAALANDPAASRRLDLVTYGPHGRRSRLLFRRALGPAHQIGVVSLQPAQFNRTDWWRSSAGFRSVTGEAIAWLYAVGTRSPAP
ncbi:MAG: YdcF family protein [Candidatus Marinimicrobia bacterium]|nr:YdcF family protein [Candidatus Neomarinimicrobiota bacterium]